MAAEEAFMVARDLAQARLLSAIFARNVRNELILKGGLAMRVQSGSVRYTKDIDLDADPTRISRDTVKARIGAAIRQMVQAGLIEKCPETPQKDTDTTLRWKLAGKVGDSTYNLTIEVSQRSRISDMLVRRVAVTRHGVGFSVDCLSPEAIAITKLQCLASSNREAPRDIFDLAVLIRMDVRPDPALLRAMPPDALARLTQGLWDKIEKMDYASARSELLPYIPSKIADTITEDVWDTMRLNVGCTIENWIRNAYQPAETVDKHRDARVAPPSGRSLPAGGCPAGAYPGGHRSPGAIRSGGDPGGIGTALRM